MGRNLVEDFESSGRPSSNWADKNRESTSSNRRRRLPKIKDSLTLLRRLSGQNDQTNGALSDWLLHHTRFCDFCSSYLKKHGGGPTPTNLDSSDFLLSPKMKIQLPGRFEVIAQFKS
jgi:hypothetical protein